MSLDIDALLARRVKSLLLEVVAVERAQGRKHRHRLLLRPLDEAWAPHPERLGSHAYFPSAAGVSLPQQAQPGLARRANSSSLEAAG